MTRLIAIANQKGGVGKTTTAINLSVAVALAGRRALLVDLDPQCNATSGLGLALPQVARGYHYLLEPQTTPSAITPSGRQGLDVLPGTPRLVDVEASLEHLGDKWRRLTRVIDMVADNYEFVFVDCPPSLGTLTANALHACGSVIIPIQCEYYAMEGLSKITQTIKRVARQKAGHLEVEGILLTMFDPHLQLANEVSEEVREFFGSKVYNAIVPRDVALSEAPSHGLSILEYAMRSRGAHAYVALAREVLADGSKETGSRTG